MIRVPEGLRLAAEAVAVTAYLVIAVASLLLLPACYILIALAFTPVKP